MEQTTCVDSHIISEVPHQSNSMWKKNNNLPVKIKISAPISFINWEKTSTCRSSWWSTCMISALIMLQVHYARWYTCICKMSKSVFSIHWILVQLAYALLANIQSETSFNHEYVWPQNNIYAWIHIISELPHQSNATAK